MAKLLLYSRNQIHDAERFAWTGPEVDGEPEFFFDGISFWRRSVSRPTERVLADHVPDQGWWHSPKCNCPLCRAGQEPASRRSRRSKPSQ